MRPGAESGASVFGAGRAVAPGHGRTVALVLAMVSMVTLLSATPDRAYAAAELPLWEAGVGLGAVQLPHYRGSDQSSRWALPLPYFVYRGRILRADRDGARLLLFDSERFDVDFSLAATAPTRSRDNRAREGMPDLAATVEFGPKVNVSLARGPGWKLDLRLPLRSVTAVQSRPELLGWSVTPVINLDLQSGAWDWGFQAGPLWGNRRLHEHFYAVSPAQATAGRPSYRAEGGFAGWQATAALSYRSGDAWVGLFTRLDSVAGASFEASPLVRSRTQWSMGVAFSWILFRSSRPAVSED